VPAGRLASDRRVAPDPGGRGSTSNGTLATLLAILLRYHEVIRLQVVAPVENREVEEVEEDGDRMVRIVRRVRRERRFETEEFELDTISQN
jgi:hypothetical protein